MSDVQAVHEAHNQPRYFMKRPVAIRAMQFNGDDSWQGLMDFTDEKVRETRKREGSKLGEPVHEVYDYLHDTWIKFNKGDWILEGSKGEFYPHEGELFKTNYEEVSMPDKVIIEV